MSPRSRVIDPALAAPHDKYQRLSPELGEQLMSIYRMMFPHGAVADEFYDHVVLRLDEQAVRDENFLGFLSNGVEVLSCQTASAWSALSPEARLQTLKSAEETPFFQRLRSDFILYFYSNPAIWPLFGYEGPSNDKGGYLHRGFNDIDWIKGGLIYAKKI